VHDAKGVGDAKEMNPVLPHAHEWEAVAVEEGECTEEKEEGREGEEESGVEQQVSYEYGCYCVRALGRIHRSAVQPQQ
jgi:hypothetical protein